LIIESNKIIELERRFSCVNTAVLRNHTMCMHAIGIEINCMDCIKQNSQKKSRWPWNQAKPETSEGEFYEDRRIERT